MILACKQQRLYCIRASGLCSRSTAQPQPSSLASTLIEHRSTDVENEFANRQNMHLAIVALLADQLHQPVWKDKPPLAFTARASAFVEQVS